VSVIRLELEVDGEVYPELHAVLAAIGNGASRAERLRQLAATGLVWETVRIRGASVIPAPPPVPSPGPAPAPRRRVGRRTIPPTDVPLLLDVVDAAPSIHGMGAQVAALADRVLPSTAESWEDAPARTAVSPYGDAMGDADGRRDEDGVEAAPRVVLMHKPAARSRVLRMRDMGLFKNG